jgi:hypothetical protein
MACLRDLDTLERRLVLLARFGGLLGRAEVNVVALAAFFVIEESRLALGTRVGHTHQLGVALRVLADELDMGIAGVLREPLDNVDALLPIDGERVVVFVVDVVLLGTSIHVAASEARLTSMGI